MKDILTFYISLHRKCFYLIFIEAVLAYDLVRIRYIKEQEVTLNGNANDKSRGIQLIGPVYLQRELS